MNLNLSKISHDSDSEGSGEDGLTSPRVSNPNFSKRPLNILASVVASKEESFEHFECPPNARKLLYDEAVEEIKGFC